MSFRGKNSDFTKKFRFRKIMTENTRICKTKLCKQRERVNDQSCIRRLDFKNDLPSQWLRLREKIPIDRKASKFDISHRRV